MIAIAAVELNPAYAEAHAALGDQYPGRKTAEAIAAYQAAIRAKPDYAMAHSNLGVMFDTAVAGWRKRSSSSVRRSRWDPNNAVTRDYLKQVQARRNQNRNSRTNVRWTVRARMLASTIQTHFRLQPVRALQRWRVETQPNENGEVKNTGAGSHRSNHRLGLDLPGQPYTDTTGDIMPSNTILDITSVEVTNTATDIVFKINLVL